MRGSKAAVAIRFTVLRDGQVQEAQITRSSGHEVLDQAVLGMLQGTAPAFTPDMTQPRITTSAVVRYRLDE